MSTKREVECLTKLNEKVGCFNEMIDYLSREKVIDIYTRHQLSNELALELPYAIHKTLRDVLNMETLQLVDYNWVLLPKETISVTIVTKHSRRDFTWNC